MYTISHRPDLPVVVQSQRRKQTFCTCWQVLASVEQQGLIVMLWRMLAHFPLDLNWQTYILYTRGRAYQ